MVRLEGQPRLKHVQVHINFNSYMVRLEVVSRIKPYKRGK